MKTNWKQAPVKFPPSSLKIQLSYKSFRLPFLADLRTLTFEETFGEVKDPSDYDNYRDNSDLVN